MLTTQVKPAVAYPFASSMAVAAWLVWRRHGWQGARWALSLYGVQLVANALWSWLFFGWRLGYWAFADVVLINKTDLAPHVGVVLDEPVREINRQRHKRAGFIAGESEHHPLIPGAPLVYSPGNIGRLGMDGI